MGKYGIHHYTSLGITILKWLQNLARNKLNSKPIPKDLYCAAGCSHPFCNYEKVECTGSCLYEWKEFANGRKHSLIRFVNPNGPK